MNDYDTEALEGLIGDVWSAADELADILWRHSQGVLEWAEGIIVSSMTPDDKYLDQFWMPDIDEENVSQLRVLAHAIMAVTRSPIVDYILALHDGWYEVWAQAEEGPRTWG